MLSQSLLLRYSYEKYQIKKMNKITSFIKYNDSDNLYQELESVAYNNEVCIQYMMPNNTISYNTLMVGCALNSNNKQVSSLMRKIVSDNLEIENIKLLNNISRTRAILSGVKVNNGYVFIYSPLEDINGAQIILRGQLVVVTTLVIFLACVISYFLSNKLTKPIVNITKKAKKLGEGNYDVEFPSSDILEIDLLANTLNHMREDLSKIDELRRDLMANVSHDLKTPLTMIKAYAEMVRDISYKDKEKREKDLNVIIEETERLNVLVNDILELSKMQASNQELEITKFDLREVIDEVIKRYDILKITEDYKFILDMPKEVMVEADKKKITQVIYNLVNNAINYTGDNKEVYVTIKKERKEYVIEIRDTGKGIKKEDIPYIWDKYYKKDKNHRRNVVSTGLGLSIVKEILTKHKFDFGVKSTLNEGTTFYFKIRVKDN